MTNGPRPGSDAWYAEDGALPWEGAIDLTPDPGLHQCVMGPCTHHNGDDGVPESHGSRTSWHGPGCECSWCVAP